MANKLGITFRVGIDKRIAGAEKVGEHKTSMLQDVEAGQPMEIEALVGAVVELGRLTETPTPHIDAVYALVSLLAKTLADPTGSLLIGRDGDAARHDATTRVTTRMNAATISEFLKAGADDAPALERAAAGAPLTYRGLRALVADIAPSLASQGIGPGDRVGIVLDNGPEMAAAFLSIGSAATAAPLNPSYRADEFEFYLTDLRAKLLVVGAGKESPAIGVAAETRRTDRATRSRIRSAALERFALQFEESRRRQRKPRTRPRTPDDIALVLHTSGTTSRPKIVPLAHKNICASAANIRNTLQLTADDRGLGHHAAVPHPWSDCRALGAAVGGRRSVLLAADSTRSSSSPGSPRCNPTWYTGVPTMHQAILLRAPGNADAWGATDCASFARRRRRCRRQ